MNHIRIASAGIPTILAIALLVAPVAHATDNLYIPASGGNWNVSSYWSLGHCPNSTEYAKIIVSGSAHKAVTYNWTGVSNYQGVTVDGSAAGYYGAIWHLDHALTTTNMYLSQNGDAWHWMEGPAYLSVSENLYVGYAGTHTGYFYLATDNDENAGLYVGDLCYVGYSAPGDFDHTGGIADVYRLYVGQNDTGTYHMRGGRLILRNHFVLGNADLGVFEQTGGIVEQPVANGVVIGLNTGGEGHLYMKGGEMNVDHISLGWNGDAYVDHTGGTVNLAGNLTLGLEGTHPYRTWYKLDESDGAAVLNVGGNMKVGFQSLAKYEQNGGTANVAGDLEIWDGGEGTYSYVYLGLDAGLLDVAGEVINHSGYYDQDGGVMSTSHFTNDSASGVNIDNNADFRATNLEHNNGTFYMWRNAILRGELAMPPSTFWNCNFTNNSTFQMGSAVSNGGTFRGILTNNGAFNYYQGDFSSSSLINYGAFNQYADFTCRRFENHVAFTLAADRVIVADGGSYSDAVQNNGTLSLAQRSHIDVGDNKLINNTTMYAGGPDTDEARILGDMENNGYLLPCLSSLGSGQLTVTGDYTSSSASQLRIRIHGTGTINYDRLIVQGVANLAGTVDVRLTSGFTPDLGDRFTVVRYGGRTGRFNTILLPDLPNDWDWDVNFISTGMSLTVVEPVACPGDLNGDGAVDLSDLAQLLAHYGTEVGAVYSDGDLDRDDDVDLSDLAALLSVYGTTCP